MAGVTNREFWDFRVKTRAQITKLAEQIANIDTSGGGGISELTSKMVVDALGYTPYNAANPANYITASALTPYAKTADVSTTYATIASVSTLQTTLEAAITKKADSATTLSGYGITDAYTKIDVDKLLEDNATKTWVNASYATVNSVTTIKNTLTGQIGAVSTNLSTLQTTVSNQAKTILANEQGLEELRTTVGDLGDAIPTNNNQLTNGAGYITSAALAPYAKTADVSTTYATIASIQGFENRIGGLEGAVPQLNERVTTVEGKVSSLNETVSTGKNNLLDRVNVIEEEYATKTYVDNAIGGIDLSPYLKTEDAKGTYATKDFVNNKLINYATIGSVTAIQNTLTGQIGAVGASVEQLAATKLDSSYFTLANIKSTLGISDWALASVKPTYTASEVGALAQDSSGASADLDTILDSKTAVLKPFFQALTNNNVGSARKGVLRISYNGSESQLLFDHYNRLIRYRTIGENPKDWATLAFTSDIPTKLSQFTDDVVAGKYLPLSGGTISGAITLGGDLNNAAGGIYIHKTNEINSFNGKLYLNHRGNGLSGYGSTNDIVMVYNGGKVGIGNDTPTERLDVSGNIKASGNINATSITINGVTITASNGSITVNGNVLATGSITAKKSV